MTRKAADLLVMVTLVAHVWPAEAGEASSERGEAGQFHSQPVRTGKERLGGKPSDEQREDNCKVPLDLRGSKPRPDDCGDERSAGPGAAIGSRGRDRSD
jgi:hypothetical protein